MDPVFFMDKGGLPLKKALNSDARLLQSILLELSSGFGIAVPIMVVV
jgi:hypothetical protein